MPATRLNSEQIGDGEVKRADLCTTIAGSSVITKLIAGTAISITSTGIDGGTGDVTINIPTTASPTLAGLTLSGGSGNIDNLMIKSSMSVGSYLGILFHSDSGNVDLSRVAAIREGPAKGGIALSVKDASLTEAVRLNYLGNLGVGTSTPKARLHGTLSTILGCAISANDNADLGTNQVNIWLDETGDRIMFKVKYSNGTIKSGGVSLV